MIAGPPTILSLMSRCRSLFVLLKTVKNVFDGSSLKREQCQSWDAYAIFEHIDVLLFVEGKLFIDGVEEWYDVSVVIRHEKVAHRLHPVVTPHCVAASVVSVGYIFVLESTVECFLRR